MPTITRSFAHIFTHSAIWLPGLNQALTMNVEFGPVSGFKIGPLTTLMRRDFAGSAGHWPFGI